MLYIAAVLFALSAAVMGLDLAGVRWAHGGGLIGNVLLLLALAVVVIGEIRALVSLHHDGHHPRHHHG